MPEPVNAPTINDFPETDTLLLYFYSYEQPHIQPLLRQFETQYGVTVEAVYISSYEEYVERVTNDLAGGAGPDVVFLDYLAMDIPKAAMNHNFLDLTELLANDPDIREEDYVDHVFETGRIRGRQYTIPTSYQLPVFLSAETKLEELGFAWDKIETTSDFLKKISRLTPQAEKDPMFQQMLNSQNQFTELELAAGFRLIDYETGEILPEKEQFKAYLEGYRAYYPYDYFEVNGLITSTAGGYGARDLIKGLYYFFLPFPQITELTRNIDALNEAGCGYVFHALPSQNGDVVGSVFGQMAINANTENALNAYRFIKMMISPEVQNTQSILISCIPIHKDGVWNYLHGTYRISAGGMSFSGYQSTTLSEEDIEAIYATLTHVDRFVQSASFQHYRMMWDAMQPYFDGEKNLNSCMKDLENKLKFYLSE